MSDQSPPGPPPAGGPLSRMPGEHHDMAKDAKPDVEPIMQFFAHDHLPPKLAAISAPFKSMAEGIVANIPRNAERSVALRKLLESKDAAVRAVIAK